ncbi:hypothetical protein [Solwaraspora sp. WMMA2065]|uniref:hypothetical protein n=1 Tax=Solwaraspora sp. WMMA2065 TaxID=3015166 RepID=UPI00259AFC6E|nr:hypothetical protein [Solwaraspora sp. WMMA2065]WJK34791.1 hypothetical protein O7610_30205 [Solwaraspora sp. WMMA2065]
MTYLALRPVRPLPQAPAAGPAVDTAPGVHTAPAVDTAPDPRAGRTGQAGTGLVVAVLALLGLAAGGPWQAPTAVAFAALGPGAALLSHLTVRPAATRWATTVLASLAGYAAVATGSVWAGWWQPRLAVGALAVAVAAVSAAGLLRITRAGHGHGSRPGPVRRWPYARRAGLAGRPAVARRPLLAHAVVIGAALALWWIAVSRTDVAQVGGFGLLGAVSPVFLAALALTVAGFVAALAGLRPTADRPTAADRATGRGLAAAGYLVLLVVLLHGTTPLLLDQPQYAWTYKHLGVIDLIAAGNPVDSATDIYQQWPALFAGAAQLGAAGGIAPAALADWSPVFFNLAAAPVLYAIARTLADDRRVAYLTVFGFFAVNWVEEDYLSPQAFGFLLSLGVLLIVLTWLRSPTGGSASDRRDGPDRRVRGWATVAALALLAVLTAAHQLSPYLVVAQVAVLAALRLVRPRWLPLAMGAVVLGYLLPRFGFVSEAFGVFDGFDIFANAAGNAESWGSTGQAFSAIVVRTLALTVWALTVLAVLAYRRRLRTVLVPALLAATPFVLLAAQSYGGEAIYRVFLFSAPWCAFLIARAVVDRADLRRVDRADLRRVGRRRRWLGPVAAVAVAVALGGFALGTVQGRHGQLAVDRQTADEVAAARQLYAAAEPGATIAVATSNFPSRLTAAYPGFNTDVPAGEPDLVVGAQLRGAALDGEHLPTIEEFLGSFAGDPAYLVVSDGMRRQSDYFGYFAPGSLDRLERLLDGRDRWSVFQRSDDVTVYRYAG